MKIFVSADIEGTTGIAMWDETENGHPRYAYFQKQMTREVTAACEGAMDAGVTEFLIKDAHDSACNLIPDMLPEEALLLRGWARDPKAMMAGLDESFGGVFFTGYHSGAGMDTSPLSHTMNGQNNYIRINGLPCSELLMNSYTAAYYGVPVRLVTGDKGLCESIRAINPNIETVAVNEGFGNATLSIHPNKAIRLIREAAKRAAEKDAKDCMIALPDHFNVEICFKDHQKAKSASHYPGMVQTGAKTVVFEADDYMDVLKMFHWVL